MTILVQTIVVLGLMSFTVVSGGWPVLGVWVLAVLAYAVSVSDANAWR